MPDEQKPRDKGIGDYTKDFVGGLFGRDNDDKPKEEAAADKPEDRGIGEVAKDFLGGLFGRKDEDEAEKPEAAKPQASANDKDSNVPEQFRDLADQLHARQDAAAAAAEAAATASNANSALADAAKQAREQAAAQAASQAAAQKAADDAARKAAEAAAAKRAQEQPPTAPKPATTGGSPDAAELERLRNRVTELEQAQQAAPPPQQRTYRVRPGDSLRAISERFYGDEMKWKRIYEANRDKIKNPDVIHVDQEFIIPE